MLTIPTVLLLTLSIIIGSLTLFLVVINWKLWQGSIGIYNVSVELLNETVIVRKETVCIREVSLEILDESILLRKALTIDVEEPKPKLQRAYKKAVKGD
jgi:hypothetical protein